MSAVTPAGIGFPAAPISSVPAAYTRIVVTLRRVLVERENVSVPSMPRHAIAGVLEASNITFVPELTRTLSPAAGTRPFDHVEAADQEPLAVLVTVGEAQK